jgi:RNA polymerase sigma-70 factor, ECF subfamily
MYRHDSTAKVYSAAPAQTGGHSHSAHKEAAEEARSYETFETIYRAHWHPLVRFFANRGFGSADSEDLAQETLYRVFVGLKDFRSQSNVTTWLLRVASNVWRNELRSRHAAKRSALEVDFDARSDTNKVQIEPVQEPSIESEILAREQVEPLRRALTELPPRMRRVLSLRFGQDLKYREIAQLLRISTDTVKAQMFQARQRLQEALEQAWSKDLEDLSIDELQEGIEDALRSRTPVKLEKQTAAPRRSPAR